MIGKLKLVPLREIWKHEEHDFSSWLFDNCEVLSDQIGLEISPIEKEKSVGPFKVDIWAEDSNGRAVVIENQLERTDHDHLGKLLTYMSNLDAKVAIWVCIDPRPEHVAAINYLNEVVPGDTHFYLLKLQAYRIGKSEPAPLFTIEAGPSEERTAGGVVKKEFAERDKIRYAFFEQLLERTNQVIDTFSSISPVGYQNWVNAGAGKFGVQWSLVAAKKTAHVNLFLCHSEYEVNKARFEMLLSKKDELERDFGEALDWDFNESRKQQYVKSFCPHGGTDDEAKWPDIQADLADRIMRLVNAIGPHIKSLK